MTQPRFFVPDVPVMISRRALRRTHLFRPDETMNQAYAYLLAWAAQKHGVEVIAAVLMSTHEHLVVLAPCAAAQAAFIRDLHRLVALFTKVYRKWDGAVWDHEKTSIVQLRTPEALIEKLAYIMANPVAAGCVPKAALWPGLTTRPDQLGAPLKTARRPSHFVDSDSTQWPASLVLESQAPQVFGMSLTQLRSEVARELAHAEAEARKDVKRKGWAWIGVRKLRAMSPFRRARAFEELTSRNPTFAVGRGQRPAFFAAATELRAFRTAYRAAFELWRTGMREVVFPVGTLAMSLLHGARVAAGSG